MGILLARTRRAESFQIGQNSRNRASGPPRRRRGPVTASTVPFHSCGVTGATPIPLEAFSLTETEKQAAIGAAWCEQGARSGWSARMAGGPRWSIVARLRKCAASRARLLSANRRETGEPDGAMRRKVADRMTRVKPSVGVAGCPFRSKWTVRPGEGFQ